LPHVERARAAVPSKVRRLQDRTATPISSGLGGLVRRFPTSVYEALAHRALVAVESIAANAIHELDESMTVRIGGRLLAGLNRLGLTPVVLCLEPSGEFACAVCVHEWVG
jgi:hypothetical protein